MFKKKYFIITVGNYISSLIYVKEGLVTEHMIGELEAKKEEIDRAFSLNRSANVILRLYNEEQTYQKEFITGSSKLEIEKIIKIN